MTSKIDPNYPAKEQTSSTDWGDWQGRLTGATGRGDWQGRLTGATGRGDWQGRLAGATGRGDIMVSASDQDSPIHVSDFRYQC